MVGGPVHPVAVDGRWEKGFIRTQFKRAWLNWESRLHDEGRVSQRGMTSHEIGSCMNQFTEIHNISRDPWIMTRRQQDPGIWQFWRYFLILLSKSYVEKTPKIAKIAKSHCLAGGRSKLGSLDAFVHTLSSLSQSLQRALPIP